MDKAFVDWKEELNKKVQDQTGLILDDYEDCPIRAWYDKKLSTDEALHLILNWDKNE
jgi:hypothetical protein